MAIAYGTTQSGRVLSGQNYSFTCGVGEKMYMVTQDNVTAITYAGVSLISLRSFTPSILDGNQVTVLLWGLSSPTSGANNFIFTCGVNASVYSVVTYTGSDFTPDGYADQWSFTTVPSPANTQVTTFTSTITTTTNNSWVTTFIVGGNNAPRTFTAGAGTTARGTTGTNDTLSIGALDSNGAITPAGSTSLISNWSSGSGFVSTITISLKPVTVPEPRGMLLFFP